MAASSLRDTRGDWQGRLGASELAFFALNSSDVVIKIYSVILFYRNKCSSTKLMKIKRNLPTYIIKASEIFFKQIFSYFEIKTTHRYTNNNDSRLHRKVFSIITVAY